VREPITSTANPRIKALARLKGRKGREESGRFLIEGHRELDRAVTAGVELDEVVLAPDMAGRRETDLAARLADGGVSVLTVGRAVFRKISMRKHPDGLLGVAANRVQALDDLELGNAALVLVLDGIEKPGNLGGIVRSADAAAVDAVLLLNQRCEPSNPNVIRASQGSVFSVPICIADADRAAAWIAQHGLQVIAASPEAAAPVWDVSLTGPIALVIGAEAEGISPTFRSPDTMVRIPMVGAADSLNASVSAGIMLYEVVRQRS
jgi:TrmH family RNA methyltransferase